MRKLAIVGLVIAILVLVIPLGIGMALGICPDCSTPGAAGVLSICASIVAVVFVAAALFIRRIGNWEIGPPPQGLVRALERPPRLP